MNAISTFLNLALIAVKLYLTKKEEAEQNEIKTKPLNYFDRKFGSLHGNSKAKNVQSAGNKSDTKRDESDSK